MNLENIEELVEKDELKKYVMKLIEYEQSQLHKTVPRYKETYNLIIEEALDENY